jgi:hypothetical protein
MEADRNVVPQTCAAAVRALSEGRWGDWRGLPETCSLAELSGAFGGAVMLDRVAHLGTDGVACSRSALAQAPVTVWHDGERILLVDIDFLSGPVSAPALVGTGSRRLDLPPLHAAAGEHVIANLGLSLLTTGSGKVVACRGFAVMPLERYLAGRRPSAREPRPHLRPTRPAPLRAGSIR